MRSSPATKAATLAVPALRVIAARRMANIQLGNTHAKPPPAAEIAPRIPKRAAEITTARIVAPNCSRTALSIGCRASSSLKLATAQKSREY
ncbi:protein of unknown function [Thauera humireducens]|nr:protein of unknown function [Thauera humireducens]